MMKTIFSKKFKQRCEYSISLFVVAPTPVTVLPFRVHVYYPTSLAAQRCISYECQRRAIY